MDLRLPAGTHYAATWGIPDQYAGMTNAFLHRSRAFVELTGTPVTVITYEYREGGYDEIRQRLTDRGHLIDGVSIVNLWEDMIRMPIEKFAAHEPFSPDDVEGHFTPMVTRTDMEPDGIDISAGRSEYRTEGKIRQVDYFRTDGTLAVSDRRDFDEPKRRWITVCDLDGQPIGTTNQIWEIYWFWLDQLPREPVAWILADSKTSANHLVEYHRDDAVVIHVVHGSHLAAGAKPPIGELTEGRKRVFERLKQWDGVVFLTSEQMLDTETLLGPGPNRHVVPNAREIPTPLPPGEHRRNRGVMLTSLTARKQIDHAIKAMAQAGRLFGKRPVLDVYGRGKLEDSLKRRAARTRRANINIRGYRDDATVAFSEASFSLLTSDNEAFGLVLVESMGRGCIPISYDLPYGPADIITHGVNGFLVPRNDIDKLAETIKKVMAMPESELAPIRQAAYERAQDFCDSHVTAQWIDVMNSVHAAKTAAVR